MTSLIIYGGYNNYPFYSESLSKSLADQFKLNTKVCILENKKNKIQLYLNFYFPNSDKKIYSNIYESINLYKAGYIINYNTNHFTTKILSKLRNSYKDIKLFCYFNDSIFPRNSKRKLYFRSIISTLEFYDHIFVYRKYDMEKLINKNNIDRQKISIVPPACPSPEYLKLLKKKSKKKYDFIFLGHYENDGRAELLKILCDLGYSLFIAGPLWPKWLIKYMENCSSRCILKPFPLNYREYLSNLTTGKVILGFTSKDNRDLYTRRYFEAPLANSIFLARDSVLYRELSSDLNNIYFYKNHLPNVEDCINSLRLANTHLTQSDEKINHFYEKNSPLARASLFAPIFY